MPAPTYTSAGEVLADRLSPWTSQDSDRGYGAAWLIHALGLQLEDVYAFSELGWDDADDPDQAPEWYLPHLAMKAGVRLIPDGLTVEQKRLRVRSTDGARRGTPEAIRGAAQVHLTGDRKVILLEREGGAYDLTVITYTDETPDEAMVEQALLEQKPAGLTLTYLVVDGWTVGQLEDAYDGDTVADLEGDFTNVLDLETNQP